MTNDANLQTANALIASAQADEDHAARLKEETEAAIMQLVQAARDKRMAAKVIMSVFASKDQPDHDMSHIVPKSKWLAAPQPGNLTTVVLNPRRTFTEEVTDVAHELENNITITTVANKLVEKGVALPNNPRIKIGTILTRLADRGFLRMFRSEDRATPTTYAVKAKEPTPIEGAAS